MAYFEPLDFEQSTVEKCVRAGASSRIWQPVGQRIPGPSQLG